MTAFSGEASRGANDEAHSDPIDPGRLIRQEADKDEFNSSLEELMPKSVLNVFLMEKEVKEEDFKKKYLKAPASNIQEFSSLSLLEIAQKGLNIDRTRGFGSALILERTLTSSIPEY